MADAMTTSGIRTRTYKSQAIVYFEGDKSESIFILKKGHVILTYLKPETGEEVKEEIRSGEFFGVKSALGRYPREETAQTIGETTILILSPVDFERLVLANLAIVKKMLRVFSNQLRRVHRAVREVMGEGDVADPSSELFKIGEYYSKNGKYEQALYSYKKYMEHYPDGRFASTSMKKIRSIESGDYHSATLPAVESAVPAVPASANEGFDDIQGSFDDSPDFGSDDFSGSDFSSPDFDSTDSDLSFGSPDTSFDDYTGEDDGSTTELSSEMDTFVSSDLNNDLLDDFDLSFDGGSVGTGGESVEDKFKHAQELFDQGDLDAAADLFEEIKTSGMDDDADIAESAVIELARVRKKQSRLQEALSELSLFVKQNPKSAYVKEALFEAGDVYLQAGNIEKAQAYLKKVASIQPRDALTRKAIALLKENRFA